MLVEIYLHFGIVNHIDNSVINFQAQINDKVKTENATAAVKKVLFLFF